MGELAARFKRPGETKTFTLLFEDMLDGDTISSVTSTVPTGITEAVAAAKNSGALTIRGVSYAANTAVQIGLSGGTEGQVYIITVDITTAAGNIHEADLPIAIVADYDNGDC